MTSHLSLALTKKKKHHAFIFNTSDFLSTWTFSASSALQEPAAEMQTASSSFFLSLQQYCFWWSSHRLNCSLKTVSYPQWQEIFGLNFQEQWETCEGVCDPSVSKRDIKHTLSLLLRCWTVCVSSTEFEVQKQLIVKDFLSVNERD